MHDLSDWDSFYVIVGSAAAGLIGLQFVAISLIANRLSKGAEEAGAAFMSPAIVHFGTIIMLAAVLRAPWREIVVVAILWGLNGLAGVLYSANVMWRMRRQTAYRPQLEDWLFHGFLPILAYILLTGTAIAAFFMTRVALFGVGAAALLLLFTGVHNAWDNVVYLVFQRSREEKQGERESGLPESESTADAST